MPAERRPSGAFASTTDPASPGRHLLVARAAGVSFRAPTEAILRRFTRNASHPVYQAMLELGRAQKTIFIARLRDRDLQGEINEGLNLIESWNRVNTVIFFGKSGEFATNGRDQQQLGMFALHILQAALVYINTLMIQDILAEPEWQDMPHRRRPMRTDRAVLGARPTLRRHHAEHDQAPRPQPGPADGQPRRHGLNRAPCTASPVRLLVTWCHVPNGTPTTARRCCGRPDTHARRIGLFACSIANMSGQSRSVMLRHRLHGRAAANTISRRHEPV
jgi:hypothetical protein